MGVLMYDAFRENDVYQHEKYIRVEVYTCITQYGSTVYIGIAMGCPTL